MPQASTTSVFARRLAAAVVLPGVLTSMLVLVPAAQAADSSTASICTGVVNQLAHRGTVQENLLKAAARKNAVLIASLQAERAGLQTKADGLTAEIAAADKAIAELEAEEKQLVTDEARRKPNLPDSWSPRLTRPSRSRIPRRLWPDSRQR